VTGGEEAAAESGAWRALLGACLAVLLASAPWFSGTAAVPSLRAAWGLTEAESARVTSATLVGFIAGTLLYALLNVADLFNPRRVFAASAALCAAFNAGFAFAADGLASALVLRFLTGVALAGVYPVAMKIVSGWFGSGLGLPLALMLGALNIGTAAPYLIQAAGAASDWRRLAGLASLSCLVGGLVMLGAVTDGPHLRARARFDPRMAVAVFQDRAFRYNAFGYFGHMWELYALWSLVAFYVGARWPEGGEDARRMAAVLGFLTVAAGAVGCAIGGVASRRIGERRVARAALLASATACLASGAASWLPLAGLTLFLLAWGAVAVADSPQFSALATRLAPREYVGTALTVQTGVGFAVTVAAIELMPAAARVLGWRWAFLALAPGPLLGAYFMSRPALVSRSD
jgi:MFS family permease